MNDVISPSVLGTKGNTIPKLTICIPTLNRANELRTSLDSISRQEASGVEIVIVDGGSTDDTYKVIGEFKRSGLNIRTYESKTKNGVDRDILQSVELATAKYCWLFSDDDVMEEGGLQHVLNAIDSNPNVRGISTNYVAYDSKLEYTIATVPAFAYGKMRNSCVLSGREEAFAGLGIHFGFISCQVVERESWMQIAENEDLSSQCNAWIIVYMIGKMLKSQSSWYYLHHVCVGYRSGNDSFIARLGVIKRQEITHLHFAHTIGALFSKGSKAYKSVFSILLRDRMPRTLAVLKAKGIPCKTQLELFKMYFREYSSYPSFWIRVVPIFAAPNWLLISTRRYYLTWRRWRSASDKTFE
jgi:abequosyltransferase